MFARTILYPTDFSELSVNALRVAESLARDKESHLILLHIVEPPHASLFTGAEAVHGYRSDDEEGIKARLHELVEQTGIPEGKVEYRLVRGTRGEMVYENILRVARETATDLIVMGSHGRTGLGRLLMGSVAEAVMRKADCPVLIVKPPAKEHAHVGEELETSVRDSLRTPHA